jgi:chorismate lyase
VKRTVRDPYWCRLPSAAGRYHAWLSAPGSLTRRIEDRCSAFRVDVVYQGLRRPDRDERFLFADGGRARVLVREVYLYCGRVPVVFAHTVVEPRHLRGVWHEVTGLGTRPLGAALFADPRVRRYPLHSRKLTAHHELHARAIRKLGAYTGVLRARRSLFTLHGSPILVTEVFLPGILDL